jgi:hypothetical protein
MQRGQINQSGEFMDDISVNYDRSGEDVATVHDAVAHALDLPPAGQCRGDLLRPAASPDRWHVSGMNDLVVITDDSQLEAARTGVDDQDPQAMPR